jgi:transketolase
LRTAFIDTLTEAAAEDDRIALVVGDLGFGVIERFRDRFPDRYVNAGVAEQDMIGISAGMALSGAVSVCYSMANFAILRSLEQIRNDVCYHGAAVKIVAVGGGLAYGALGVTHHGTEDIAALRSMPEMRIVVPADAIESRWAVGTALETPGPFYIRLGRNGEPNVHEHEPELELGRAAVLRDGTRATVIGIGSVLGAATAAADALRTRGIDLRVLSMHTVVPLDREAVLAAAAETGAILTLEEHCVTGGLGSAVAEVLADAGLAVRFRRLGLPQAFVERVGSHDDLRRHYGLTADGVEAAVVSLLGEGRAL